MKFKVGQNVRIMKCALVHCAYRGKTGTITSITVDARSLLLWIVDMYHSHYPEEVKLVKRGRPKGSKNKRKSLHAGDGLVFFCADESCPPLGCRGFNSSQSQPQIRPCEKIEKLETVEVGQVITTSTAAGEETWRKLAGSIIVTNNNEELFAKKINEIIDHLNRKEGV